MKDMLKIERAILKGFSKRDNKVVKKFIDDHYQKAASYIKGKGGSNYDVDELVQEALVVLFNVSKSKEFELEGRVVDYFFGTIKFLYRRKLRNKSELHTSIEDRKEEVVDNENDIDDNIIQNERYELYEKHLLTIDDDCKMIFNLVNSGMNTDDILKKMNYTLAYLYKKRSLCKKKLLDKIMNDPKYQELVENAK
jgi:RNA polymerase sigma factor (sigma-70 family)